VTLDRRAFLTGAAALGAVGGLPARARGLATIPKPDREAMVPVAGGRVYVRVNGDLRGPKPPLVAIHGGPGGTHNALAALLPLADERAVILYDQLDCGRSERPGDPRNWTVARFTGELEAIRAALGVERWHVCGHSWGGTIALEYGARRPVALAGLVLASPLVSTRSWIADADALRAELPPGERAALAVCDRVPVDADACETASAPFYRAFNGRERPSAALAAYERAGAGNPRLYRTMWGASEFVATGTLRDYDGEPLLARLEARRTLLMVGQYDEARPATALAFARRMPGSEIAVIPGAAHATMIDRPDETVATLRGFLARQDGLG
jgi:L-proline amide hydrolase